MTQRPKRRGRSVYGGGNTDRVAIVSLGGKIN